MIVYEIRVCVAAEIAEAYREWLGEHVREILTLPGFQRAELLAEDSEAGLVWVVRYHLASRAALADYLRDHAQRLRAEGLARFGERFSATRRVLEMRQEFV